MPVNKPYTDHLGNKFESLSAMARYWDISDSTLNSRLAKGISVEQALTYTTEDMKRLNTECKDHLGNTYQSKNAMCQAYGIDRQVYFGRIAIGWSVKDALTTPINAQPANSKIIKDHTGQEFKSISDMCKKWNIGRSTYNARIKQGWTIEKALTTKAKKIDIIQKEHKDHLGNTYPSLTKMCEHYGITHYTFHTRVNKLGWSVEKALTTSNTINATTCTDNMGHTFPSLADMCHFYGIPAYKLQGKKLDNEQLHKCLISQFVAGRTIQHITIKKCVEFPFYLCKDSKYEIIITFDKLLELYHNDNFYPLPKTKITDPNLIISSCIEFPYYEVIYKNSKEIWDYWKIIQYRHDSNFGLSSNR